MSLTKYLSYISFPNPESIQAMHPITIFPQNIYIILLLGQKTLLTEHIKYFNVIKIIIIITHQSRA